MRGFFATTAMAAIIAGTGFIAAAHADEFTRAQKDEIRALVKDYLLKNPEILIEMSAALERKRNEQQARKEEEAEKYLKAHAGEIFTPRPLDPTIGPKDAKITLIEFYDYNCAFCKRALADLRRLVEENPDVRVIFKEFPILASRTGGGSLHAALASMAVYRLYPEKFWEFHQQLMNFPGVANRKVALKIAEKMGLDVKKIEAEMASPDMQATLAGTDELSRKLAIDGTPAFVAPGMIIRGAPRYETLQQIVERARKAAKKNGGQPKKG